MGKAKGGAECPVCFAGCFLRERTRFSGEGAASILPRTYSQLVSLWAMLSPLLSPVPAQPVAGPGTPSCELLTDQKGAQEASRSSAFSHPGSLPCHGCISPGLRAAQATKDYLSLFAVMMRPCPRLSRGRARQLPFSPPDG